MLYNFKKLSTVFLFAFLLIVFSPVRKTYVQATDSPPTIEIQSPKNDEFVKNTIPISIKGEDDIKIDRVEFFLDGQKFDTQIASPYSSQIDTLNYEPGTHTLLAKICDSSEQTAQSQIKISFYQTPQNILTIVQISDTHVEKLNYGTILRGVLGDINNIVKPAVIIHTGDLVETPTTDNFQLYKTIASASKIPIKSIPGNHDLTNPGYTNLIGPTNISFDLDNYLFVGVGFARGPFSGANNTWMRNLLSSTTKTGIILYHYPWGIPDFLLDYNDPSFYALSPGDKTVLMDLISAFHVPLYLSGHVHTHFILEDSTTGALNLSAPAVGQTQMYEIITIDNGVISNKTAKLGIWPQAVITSPKLFYSKPGNGIYGSTTIRAKVFGDRKISTVTIKIDNDAPIYMADKNNGIWETIYDFSLKPIGLRNITVSMVDEVGKTGETKNQVKVELPSLNPTPTPFPTPTPIPTPIPSCQNTFSQTVANGAYNLGTGYGSGASVSFTPPLSAGMKVIDVMAGMWGSYIDSITCKLEGPGSSFLGETTTVSFSGGGAWRALTFPSVMNLTTGTTYTLYCRKTNLPNFSAYWNYNTGTNLKTYRFHLDNCSPTPIPTVISDPAPTITPTPIPTSSCQNTFSQTVANGAYNLGTGYGSGASVPFTPPLSAGVKVIDVSAGIWGVNKPDTLTCKLEAPGSVILGETVSPLVSGAGNWRALNFPSVMNLTQGKTYTLFCRKTSLPNFAAYWNYNTGTNLKTYRFHLDYCL